MSFPSVPALGLRHDNVVLVLGAYLAQDVRPFDIPFIVPHSATQLSFKGGYCVEYKCSSI